ncbi:MAG: hypothetical protein KC643_27210 [Nitrospira sp.]|nr:hypothetical protein [Nitrospira sp.]
MTHKTAILGWGSLLWEGGEEFDRWRGDWSYDGPRLPIEFSRISSSREGALTLVVDAKNGVLTTVAWCVSKRKEPADAVADLRCREGCGIRYIARLDGAAFEDAQGSGKVIAEWAKARDLDSVVWTALESNFETKAKESFSVDSAIRYLQALPRLGKARAAEYVGRAPEFVQTPLRAALENQPWFRA